MDLTIDANTTTIALAIIAATLTPIVTHVLKSRQDRAIAKAQAERDVAAAAKVQQVAVKVEETQKEAHIVAASTGEKLDTIHTLVNSRLTEAIERLKDAISLLVKIAPDDQRVKDLNRSNP